MPAIASPCIGVCRMDEHTAWCRGCYRSIAEIIVWAQSTDSEKQAIWRTLTQRHRQHAFAEAANNPELIAACTRTAPCGM